MAKQKMSENDLTDVFTSTAIEKPKGKRKPTGVNLYESEVEELDSIAAELGVKRSELLHYSVKLFLRLYSKGEIQFQEVKTTKKLPVLPD